MLIKAGVTGKQAASRKVFRCLQKASDDRRMKKFLHIFSLFFECIVLPFVNRESICLHIFVANMLKLLLLLTSSCHSNNLKAQLLASLASEVGITNDGSARICFTASLISLGPVVVYKYIYMHLHMHSKTSCILHYTMATLTNWTGILIAEISLHHFYHTTNFM